MIKKKGGKQGNFSRNKSFREHKSLKKLFFSRERERRENRRIVIPSRRVIEEEEGRERERVSALIITFLIS